MAHGTLPQRILILGCWGQVGRALQLVLGPRATVIPWDKSQCDLTHLPLELDRFAQAIQTLKPDVIINGAAYTAVDRAEEEPELAQQINGTALQSLAQLAHRCGATLVHISTDYVFNGFGHRPYGETDAPDPLGIYGRSKLAGEKAIVAEGCDRYLILRTAWVYSEYDRPNFLKTMVRLGQEREVLQVVADQVGSPTWARDIAEVIAALMVRIHQDPSLSGIYHYSNSGVASWYDFAVAIFEEAIAAGWSLKLKQLIPIATEDYPTPAQRPAYSVLNCHKVRQVLQFTPPHWHQSLRQAITQLPKP
ncbi:dTDP-4-dehydrorhamnose reductase [Prochlorothrix hollandica PCC 9006 = CALU 1027]|uniref:dTDP-4-dehydrorhamnose reductase n=2 Tax=Prochlorothrix hollandica TaxID=1223 RepID=A0A0M2Q2Z1_PROHO|nr:dTDP-4-dehydrorhamnose reductase [Prochlorothrix hollandica PCC 9006 = CALU 1027]